LIFFVVTSSFSTGASGFWPQNSATPSFLPLLTKGEQNARSRSLFLVRFLPDMRTQRQRTHFSSPLPFFPPSLLAAMAPIRQLFFFFFLFFSRNRSAGTCKLELAFFLLLFCEGEGRYFFPFFSSPECASPEGQGSPFLPLPAHRASFFF